MISSLQQLPLWMVKKKWRQKPLRSFFTLSELENIRKTSVFRRVFSTSLDVIDEDEYESIVYSIETDDQINTLIRLSREKTIFTIDYEKEEISNCIQFFLKMLSRCYLSSEHICELLPLFNYFTLEDDPYGVEDGLKRLLIDILKENDEKSYLPVIAFLMDEANTSWISRYSPRPVRVGVDSGCSVLCDRYLDNMWLACLPKKYIDESLKKSLERQKKVDGFFEYLIKGYQRGDYNDIIVECIISHIKYQKKKDLVPYLRLIHDDQRISTDRYSKILNDFGINIDTSLSNLSHCTCCGRPLAVCKKERKTLKKKRRKELVIEIEELFARKKIDILLEKTSKYFTEFAGFGRKDVHFKFLRYRYLGYISILPEHSELALIDFYNLHREITSLGKHEKSEGEKLEKELFEKCKFLKKLDHYHSTIDRNYAKKIGVTKKIDIFERFLKPSKEYRTSQMRYTYNNHSKEIVFYQYNIGIASFSSSSSTVILGPEYLQKVLRVGIVVDRFFMKGPFIIFTLSRRSTYPRKGRRFTVIRLMNENKTKIFHFITDSLKPKLESLNSRIESFEVFVTLKKRVYIVALTRCCLFFFDLLGCRESSEGKDVINPTFCTFKICGYEFRDVKFFGGHIFASVGRGVVEYEFCEERKEAILLKQGYVDINDKKNEGEVRDDDDDSTFFAGIGLKKIFVSKNFIIGIDLSKRDYGDEDECEYATYRGRIVVFSKNNSSKNYPPLDQRINVPIAIHRLDEENRDGNLEFKAKIGRFLFFVYRVIGGEKNVKEMVNELAVVLDLEDGTVLEFECSLNHPIDQIHLVGEKHHDQKKSVIRVLFVGQVENQYISSSLYDLVFFHKVDDTTSSSSRLKDDTPKTKKKGEPKGKMNNFVCSFCCFVSKDRRLSRCSGCKTVLYCSRKCQKRDWKRHRKVCRRFRKNL